MSTLFVGRIEGWWGSSGGNATRFNRSTGRTYKDAEYEAWMESAILQLSRQMANGGHQLIIEQKPPKFRKDKRTGLSIPVDQKPRIVNPIFDKGFYDVRAFVFSSTKRRDKNNKKAHWGYDAVGLEKAINDSLSRSGIIRDDEFVANYHCSDMRRVYGANFWDVDEKPVIVVAVQWFTWPVEPLDGFDPLVVARPPTDDNTVYMPTVFDSQKDWVKLKRQEKAFQEYLAEHGVEAVPAVTKAICKACHLLIGAGHYQQEVCWRIDETRWGKTVAITCGACRDEAFEATYPDTRIDRMTLALFANIPGFNFDDVPRQGHPHQGIFNRYRTELLNEQREKYRNEHTLISREEIAEAGWVVVEERRAAKQLEMYPHDHHSSRKAIQQIRPNRGRRRPARRNQNLDVRIEDYGSDGTDIWQPIRAAELDRLATSEWDFG